MLRFFTLLLMLSVVSQNIAPTLSLTLPAVEPAGLVRSANVAAEDAGTEGNALVGAQDTVAQATPAPSTFCGNLATEPPPPGGTKVFLPVVVRQGAPGVAPQALRLPPDPALVASPLDPDMPTDIYEATKFIYTGANAIQTGVAPGTIAARCVAVLRGKVIDRAGKPLAGVEVSILDHAEFGRTLSRADGAWDLVVNGGAQISVRYTKSGMLPAQRLITPRWRDYAWLPDVALIPTDTKTTVVNLGSSVPWQSVRSSTNNDADGARTTTLIIPAGTTGSLVMPDGSERAVSRLTMRATEYTVGPNGVEAMPGELPPASGYTYAAEFTADEAVTAGARDVRFSKPVMHYVENFIDFPVGGIVPVGYFDRDLGQWVPTNNGRVIKFLRVVSGAAEIDADGDGAADSAAQLALLGIETGERQRLAALYQPGQTLWRVVIDTLNPTAPGLADEEEASPVEAEEAVPVEVEGTASPAPIADKDAALAAAEVQAPRAALGNAAPQAGVLTADYRFQNFLNSSVPGAPDVTNLGSGTSKFGIEQVDGGQRIVYQFPRGNGLQLTPTTTVMPNTSYTIVMLFRFESVSGWTKLLDYNNGTNDRGLYVRGGSLNFYPLGVSGQPNTIAPNIWTEVRLTRAADKTVTAYVNGVQHFQFVDTSDDTLVSNANTLRFFIDDRNGGENSAGAVANIKIYDGVQTGPVRPSPTRTPTASATSTTPGNVTVTPSRTPTPTQTRTPTPTTPGNVTVTPSRTPTPTMTASPTKTPTKTRTPTPSKTRTPTPTREVDFSVPWDHNWPYGPPDDAQFPNGQLQEYRDRRSYGPCPPNEGSIIYCESQTLAEQVGVTGTGFQLHYTSDRVPGRKDLSSIEIPLSDAALPGSTKRIELEVLIAGQRHLRTFEAKPNQRTVFVWDGKDGFGRNVTGAQMATVRIGYVYPAVYQRPNDSGTAFGAGSGESMTMDREKLEITFWQEQREIQGSWNRTMQELGGWTLDVHHAFDPARNTLYRGNGEQWSADAMGDIVTTIAGTGEECTGGPNCNLGGLAVEAALYNPHSVEVGPDGSVYVSGFDGLKRITPDGVINEVPGVRGFVDAFALGPDGSIYYVEETKPDLVRYIRRVLPNGTEETIAGNGSNCEEVEVDERCGIGGPAIDASFWYIDDIAMGPDGSLFFESGYRIFRIGLDGIVTTVAGNGDTCNFDRDDAPCGDGGPARDAGLHNPDGIAVGQDGSLFILDTGNCTLRRVGPDGIIRTLAGKGMFECGFSGDGGPGTAAKIDPAGGGNMAVTADGAVLFADARNHRIRRVGRDGIITTIAGSGVAGINGGGFAGDGGPATLAQFDWPVAVALSPDGTMFIADRDNERLRRVGSSLGNAEATQNGLLAAALATGSVTIPAGHRIIPSKDGTEVYEFDTRVRHVRTIDALTGAVRFTFDYDANGKLATITDASNNVARITRTATTITIVAPGGQTTTLGVDANGYLNRIENPAREAIQLTSNAEGLLQSLRDPENRLHTFEYDVRGMLVRDAGPDNRVTTLQRTTTGTSSSVLVTTGTGRTSTYTVESLADGSVRRTVVDEWGQRIVSVKAPDGKQTTTYPDGSTVDVVFAPDPRWGTRAPYISSMTMKTPGGRTARQTVSRTATLAQEQNPLSLLRQTDVMTTSGRAFTTAWDSATRRFTTTSPEGHTSTTTLDALGRVVERRAAASVDPVVYTYDAKGRLATAAQGAQRWTYAYDAANRMTSRTDALNEATSYTYDAADRALTIKLPSGHTYTYTYDKVGNQTSIKMPSGDVHTMEYTGFSRLEAYRAPGATAGVQSTYNADQERTELLFPSGRRQTWTTDANGRISGVADPAGTTSIGYAGTTMLPNLLRRTPTGGTAQDLAMTYDGALQTGATFSGPAAGTFGYRYGDDLLLTGIRIDGGAELAITYNRDGQRTAYGPWSITRGGPNGDPTRMANGTWALGLTFDNLGRTATRTYTVGTKEVYKLALTHDNAGRLRRIAETVEGTATTYDYAYDVDGQLTEVKRNGAVVESYAYDPNGNRIRSVVGGTTETATFDDQDRLLKRGSVAYQFDADGWMTGRGNDRFTYSVAGELLQAKLANGTEVRYGYDALGRRTSRTDSAGTTAYLYGNPDDAFQVTASRDASGLTTYVYDEGGRLIGLQRGGQHYRVATDHLGSVRVVTDAAGAVVKRLQYTSWGVQTADSNPAWTLPFGYAGGLADPVTGLVRFGFRDYEPAAGRWVSRDPALYNGGQHNLYAYVGNQPVAYTDPSGLYGIQGSGCAAICLGGRIAYVPGKGASVSFEGGVGSPGASVEAFPGPNQGLENDGLSIFGSASMRAGPVSVEGKIESFMDDCGNFQTPVVDPPKGCIGPACLSKDGPTWKSDPQKTPAQQWTGVGTPKAKAGVKVRIRLWDE
jgi:RHS repeat-associated protein